MRRNSHLRTYKVIYRIYSVLFVALGIYTVGFFIFSLFDSRRNLGWSDYWDVAQFLLISMGLLLVFSLLARYSSSHSR